MRKLIIFAVIYIAAACCGMGQVYQGPNPYPHDIFGGLTQAPCQTRQRQANSTGIVRSALDLNNATTGWEGYWHDLKVSGRWFICDPMDNAFFSNSFEIPGLNQYAANYPKLLAKYGDPPASSTQAVINYMNAEAKRMQAFGFNTVGNNLGTGNVEALYFPFPNWSSTISEPNPAMPAFMWPHATDISTRRTNFATNQSDNWGYHTIKKMPAMYPTMVFGAPQAFPGVTAGTVPLVDWMDIFDPQWICSQSEYATYGAGVKPSYCPQTNNVSPDMITADLIGGSVQGTTETLMNGSSSGPFAPGTYTVTVASSAGLSNCAQAATPCTVMLDPGLADGEDDEISNISGSTFQVTTTQSHPQGFVVRSGTDWIFAQTAADGDYFGGIVDEAENGAGGNFMFQPGVGLLVSSPSATTLNFQSIGSTYGTTTFTANVTHSSSAQTVAVANASVLPCGQSGTYFDVSKGTSSEEILLSCTNVDSTHISAVFRLDHASGDALTTVWGTGENGPPIAYFGPSGVSQNFTVLSSAISAGGQCLTVVQTAPFSTASPNNTVTFDPGMKGYDSTTYEDGPYSVDGIGTSGPAGCNGANNVHITTGTAHAHASGARLETPLGIDTVSHTKAELQAWLEGSGISGSYGTGAGAFDDLTSGHGYGTGDTGICKLDEAWGLIESSYNCTTLSGWPLTYAGTVTQTITGAATAQTVTVSSTTGLAAGRYLDVSPATTAREMVRITAIGTGTVTGIFLQNHSSGAIIQAGGYAHWGSAGLGAWKEESTQDPGRYFLDENGFHTWISAVDGNPGPYDGWMAEPIGDTATTGAVAPGSNITIDVADIRGIREGTTVYLDGHSQTNRQAVTASGVTTDTYPAGHFTATVTGSYTYPAGTLVTSQMFNDVDSMIMHYADYYVTEVQNIVNGGLPGVPVNPVDSMQGSRYSVWVGMGRSAVMFESAPGGTGNLCVTGQQIDDDYTDSGNQVPILMYFRADAQSDSEYRDLATTSNDAVAATGSQTVHLACAESGVYPCNVPSSSSTAYNVTIDPDTASEEVASCTFNLVAGAGNSTMTCTFAKTHTSGFSVWAAIAHPTQAYGTSDWSTPTQDAKGQFYYDFWLTGNTESYCPTKCSSWTAPIINPPFCPAFGYGSNPAPASNPRDFGNLAGTAGGAWHFQADNGDYPFIGTAVWEMYPYSDNESYGFASENDNQYDGKEDVSSTACTGWEGYSCGGEAQNYGDALIKVTQANHQIWSNIVQWLGSH